MSEYDIFQIDVVKGYGMTELNHGLKDPKTCLMKCPMSRSHDIPLYRHPDMGAMKTIMEGFLDDYNMSDLLYHRQRVLNAKISPLQVHQLSGFQERVRCFDTGRLLCLSQRPLRPEMVQTHFKVYLISSVCAPENVLQTKRERKRVAKKVFVQIFSMSVSEFLVPSCSRAGSAQFCYHVL